MKTPKIWAILAFSTICAVSSPSFGQQRVFNWLPANDESVRLDPANYHSGRTYHPGSNGGNIHVDIKAQQPITIFLTDAEAWTQALQHPEGIAQLRDDFEKKIRGREMPIDWLMKTDTLQDSLEKYRAKIAGSARNRAA